MQGLRPRLLAAQEMRTQARLAGPLGADLVLTHSLTLVALAFVARLGMAPLAIVVLGTTVYELAGRLVLGGLCNALDTVAAQACAVCILYAQANAKDLPLFTLFAKFLWQCTVRLGSAVSTEYALTRHIYIRV